MYILISNIGRNLNFQFCCNIFINRNICALQWVSFITKLLLLAFQKQSRTSSNNTNKNTKYTRHSSNDSCNWVSNASHLIDCCSITWFFYIMTYCTNICNLNNVKKQKHYCTTTRYNLINIANIQLQILYTKTKCNSINIIRIAILSTKQWHSLFLHQLSYWLFVHSKKKEHDV